MTLKKQIAVIFIFCCTSIYSQTPIHKVEKDCNKSIDYRLESKKSNIILNDSLSFIEKLNDNTSIKNFIVKNKAEINVFITSLDVIKIKNGNLNFNKFKKSKYQPDLLLNEFLEKNISFESFSNLDKKKKYSIGVYMFYNFQNSLHGIEFVELKDGKYHLIYRFIKTNE